MQAVPQILVSRRSMLSWKPFSLSRLLPSTRTSTYSPSGSALAFQPRHFLHLLERVPPETTALDTDQPFTC